MTQSKPQLMKFKTECDHAGICQSHRFLRPALLALASLATALGLSAQAGVYENAVLSDSPVAYYPLDLTNGTAQDLTGNGNDGAFVNIYPGDNSVAGPSTYIPNGVSFDGMTTYVDLSVGSHPELLNFGGLISLEAWVQAPGGGNNPGGYIIGKGYDNNFSADEIEIRVDGDGSGYYYFHGGVFSGTNGDQFAEGGTCDTTWAHVVVTWDGTNWNLYQNGFLQDSEADEFGPPNFADPWRIGDGTRNAANRNFTGNLTQVALYTNALTPRQALAHYYVGIHGTTNVPPVLTVQPLASQIGGIGGSVSFSCQAVSLLDMTYQWYKNGAPLTDQTNATLLLTALQSSDAGAYRVKVSNNAGYITSDVANLSVGNEGVYGFSPILLTLDSYNEDAVVEASALGRATTATIDAGTNNSGTTFFEQGFYADDPTIGLPAANSTMVDATMANHTYKMPADYTANNAAVIFANNSATLTLTTQAIYGQLSILEAGAAGSLSYTVTYANGKTDKGTLRVQDWFTATNSAIGNVSKAFGAGGRADVTSRSIDHWSAGSFPFLTAYDIALSSTAASSPVVSVTLSVSRNFAGHIAVLALSGSNSASGNQFLPIAFGGYNQDIVLEAGAQHFAAGAFTTATMDSGLDQDGYTWYERGYSSTVNWAPGSGLPPAGSALTNQTRPDRVYKLAPSYAAEDVVYLDEATSQTITPATPATYWALSFLTASENWSGGSQLFLDYAAHHADRTVETGTFAVPDWELGIGTVAYLVNGAVHAEHGDADAGNNYPSLYSTDIGLTNLTSPVTSIDLSFSSANTDSGTIMVLAVSGAYMNQSRVFNSASRNPDGSLALQFSGLPGYRYQVQFTTSLAKPVQWQSLGTVTADAAGLLPYLDTAAPAHAAGFYRMLYLP